MRLASEYVVIEHNGMQEGEHRTVAPDVCACVYVLQLIYIQGHKGSWFRWEVRDEDGVKPSEENGYDVNYEVKK